MAFTPRVKSLESNVYSPTKPASEAAIRQQIDDSIQEVFDNITTPLLSTEDGSSGMDLLGMTPIGGQTTPQNMMEYLFNRFNATKPTLNITSVLDYGADNTGVTDSTNAFISAFLNKNVFIPSGTYKLNKVVNVNLISNQTIMGSGIGSTILEGANFKCDNQENVKIQSLTIQNSNKPLEFTNTDNITIFNIKVVGDVTEVSPRGIEFTQCNNTIVDSSYFKDVQYGVYYKLGLDGFGEESTNCKITKNTFIQNNATISFPAGVYLVAAIDVLIENNYFNCPSSVNQGYAIYQGDNTTQQCKNIIINANTFKESNDSDIRIDKAFNMIVSNNITTDSLIFFRSNGDIDDPLTAQRSNHITITGNVIKNAEIIISGQSKEITIHNNTLSDVTDLYGIYVQGDSMLNPITDIKISNNIFRNIDRAGILLLYVIGAEITNNKLIDCNAANETSNTSNRSKAISVEVADELRIFDNHIENTAFGFARYAIAFTTATYPNVRYGRNTFVNMVVSGYRNQYTSAPIAGKWEVGDRVPQVNPVATGLEGWVCVTKGTPGTWKTFGTVGA